VSFASASGELNQTSVLAGLGKLFTRLWKGVGSIHCLDHEESVSQFHTYYVGRVVPRLEEAKRVSTVLKTMLEKPSFTINGEEIPNVYQTVLSLFESKNNLFYPRFLVPFVHRDLNPENILIRQHDRGDSKAGDFVLIDCSSECIDKNGKRSFQELAPDFGKLCFGFCGYSSIIINDYELIECGNTFSLSLGKHTNIELVKKILTFLEEHEFFSAIYNLEPAFINRVKFNIIISFLADLKYRESDKSKLANLLQASFIAHMMGTFKDLK